ncbi:MAG: DNA polymerase III subunit beta [Planctomycetes bacterium]|nr:DNA polymerase III subunit beta [Planctomycetota bacterium]
MASDEDRHSMKLICQRESLLQGCQLASSVLPTKDIKPVLANIKIVAEPGRVTLQATDLELGLRLDVAGVNVLQAGQALLPASRIVSILREARVPELEIECDRVAGSGIAVSGGSLEYELPFEDPDQFPDLPDLDADGGSILTAGPLREMIRRTTFACASETARFTMTGVHWSLESDGNARLVATDGRRLAMATGSVSGVKANGTAIIPSKAMHALERNLLDDEEEIRVVLRPSEALFRTGRSVLSTRLVEGRFPDYKAVIPKREKITAKIPLQAGALFSAVRQAAIMVDDETRKLVLNFNPGKLSLQAAHGTGGKSKVELPIEHQGASVSIAFNPQYLLDMLKQLPADAPLEVDLIDGNHPALFRLGESFLYLVMPLS